MRRATWLWVIGLLLAAVAIGLLFYSEHLDRQSDLDDQIAAAVEPLAEPVGEGEQHAEAVAS